MSTGTIGCEEKIPFSASNEWDLIRFIALQLSSRDPRVSVKELIDNAFDAFSSMEYSPSDGKQVKIILRKKIGMIHTSRYSIMDLDGNPTRMPPIQEKACPILNTQLSTLATRLKRNSPHFRKQRLKAGLSDSSAWVFLASGLSGNDLPCIADQFLRTVELVLVQ